ncbi:unnamed protein product [Paramecium primaurelia]|uniref:Uncharacterized protein n=1 Tax=Paramecium primaurelia TaxID=5886 RepID=A0A8S1MG77_PARPR|nr:unnamed protein product [Paramecium primaurelia]
MYSTVGMNTVASQLSKKEPNDKEIPDNKNINAQENPIEMNSIKDSSNKQITQINTHPSLFKIEIFIELCTITLFIYTYYEFFTQYELLPSTIDIDFGSRSSFEQVNKQYLIIILIGATFLLILISSLQMFTHKFKYRVAITPQNSEFIFRYTRLFLSSEKLITMGLFMYDTISIFKIIQKQWQPLSLYLSAIFILPYITFWMIYNKKMNQIADNQDE